MKHDWKASIERMAAVNAGETPDRVPFAILNGEALGARISGLTVKEMMMSPKKLAEVSIQVSEFLGHDLVSTVLIPYAGPWEALAFAKVNGKADIFSWSDYGTPHIPEGKLCDTEKAIERLEIPDHRKVEPWPTILKAMAIIKEKVGIEPRFAPSLTWSNLQMLRGSQAYMDILTNPDLLLLLCEKIYASQMDLYHAFCSICGKPTVAVNAQYAFNRQMLSFQNAWEFEGQFVERMCKETECALFVHNCGFEPYWDEMIEKFRDVGVPVVGLVASHPLDIDQWVQFRKKFPDIVIQGITIYVNDHIQYGTPEDVMKQAKYVIEKIAPYKRFILSPVCTVDWRMPLSNIFAIREAVEKYGRYPINVVE